MNVVSAFRELPKRGSVTPNLDFYEFRTNPTGSQPLILEHWTWNPFAGLGTSVERTLALERLEPASELFDRLKKGGKFAFSSLAND